MTGWRTWIAVVAGLVLTGGAMGPSLASAQQTEMRAQASGASASEEKPPNTGRVSLGLGADWASAYYFRGIANVQNGGSNVQPYAEIGFKLLENAGPLTSLVITPGIWNNFQYGDEGRLVEPSDPRFWFESDLYAKLSATWWEVFTTGVTYTYYTSPNDSFTSYADVGLSFGLNDAKWLGDFALNPSLLFAFETKGEALVSDDNKGIYMGIGLAPGYTFFADTPNPINVSAAHDRRVQRQGLLYGQREQPDLGLLLRRSPSDGTAQVYSCRLRQLVAAGRCPVTLPQLKSKDRQHRR